MIYTRFGAEVQILSVVDVDQQEVRCQFKYDNTWSHPKTVAVINLKADGGINEIMTRIKELTGVTP